MKFARVTHCNNGNILVDNDRKLWQWRFHRCNTCDVVVLPLAVSKVALANVLWKVKYSRFSEWWRKILWESSLIDCDSRITEKEDND